MKILFVIDQLDSPNNGTTVSALRFANGLREIGHEVYLAGCGKSGEFKYIFKPIHMLPIASHIIHSQGMKFSMPNKKNMKDIMRKFDVVHFYTPFFLSISGLKVAQELNIPHTAAFHVQPENITYTLNLGKNENVNDWIYDVFRDKFYNQFTHIHCPSNFIANELKVHGYTAKLHVISNGISPEFKYQKTTKPEKFKDKFIITMVGRYSNEKRQDVLIDAVEKSKYSNNIQLILAGKGPKESSYKSRAKKLKNYPIFNFFNKPELLNVLSYTDLYVHPADAEIEAISCMEAIACGNVPVISNSEKSATPQFSLTENSLFESGNSSDLAKKIDFWIEHPELKAKMSIEYAESMNRYRIKNSVKQMEEMFKDAIKESAK